MAAPVLTHRAQRFLELTAAHWSTFIRDPMTAKGSGPMQRICKLVPCNPETVSHWRRAVPGFRERERLARAASKGQEHMDKEVSSWAMARFFEILEETDDRVSACQEIGARWSDVEKAIREHPGFSRRYQDYETEWAIRAEDILRKEVAGGDRAAARAYLAAHDPRYMPGQKGRPTKGESSPSDPAKRAAEALDWLDGFLEEGVN